MRFLIDLIPAPYRLFAMWIAITAALAALGGLYAWRVHVERHVGRAEVRAEWNAAKLEQADADLKASQDHARETLRRLEAQQRNQDAQDQQLAIERRDAARDRTERDSLREQNLAAAKRWSATLSDSPSVEQCAAAGTTIMVQADVLGRSDQVASELAEYSGTARAAGLKCQADYDALTPKGVSTVP